jgi:hypothetical protein
VLKVEPACEPDNINWYNLQASGIQKLVRRMLSWTLTIALMAVPLLIVVIISRSLKDLEPLKLSCPPQGTFSDTAIKATPSLLTSLVKDYESSKSENLMFCYCYESFAVRFYQ